MLLILSSDMEWNFLKQLCIQVEGDLEREKDMIMVEKKERKPKRSFKQLVQRCMTGQGTRRDSWS